MRKAGPFPGLSDDAHRQILHEDWVLPSAGTTLNPEDLYTHVNYSAPTAVDKLDYDFPLTYQGMLC